MSSAVVDAFNRADHLKASERADFLRRRINRFLDIHRADRNRVKALNDCLDLVDVASQQYGTASALLGIVVTLTYDPSKLL